MSNRDLTLLPINSYLIIITIVILLLAIILFLTALGFLLNEVPYPNGSAVLWLDIGEGESALKCTTDSATCCTNKDGQTRGGEFYFPNGTMVPVRVNATSSYYRTRGSMLISLNRRSNHSIATQPTDLGQFRCEIPDANGTMMNLSINIGMVIIIRKRNGGSTLVLYIHLLFPSNM